MSLTKPILNPVAAFDAEKPKAFTFNSIGGSQVIKNRLVITENQSGTIIYNETVETLLYAHTVPANRLTNGVYYEATLYTFDALGNQSPASNAIQFYCYTTPTLEFTNLNDNSIVNNATYTFSFNYDQLQKEALNSWILNIYEDVYDNQDRDKRVATSGVQYTGSSSVPFSGFHTVSGFENDKKYYAILSGETINKTIISTPRVHYTVKYIQPEIYTPITLTNNCMEGYIEVRSNIGIIDGTASPTPPTYLNGTEIDLTAPNSYANWNKGISVIGDFVGFISCRALNKYTTIFNFIDDTGNGIKIDYNLGYLNSGDTNPKQCYVKLTATQGNFQYSIRTELRDIPSTTDRMLIRFGRKNNLYDIYFGNEVI